MYMNYYSIDLFIKRSSISIHFSGTNGFGDNHMHLKNCYLLVLLQN